MLQYAAKRLLLSIVIVAVAVTLLFCMIFLVPGDPAAIALGPRATPELKEALRARMGLDQPVPIQLLRFFGNILQVPQTPRKRSRQAVPADNWRGRKLGTRSDLGMGRFWSLESLGNPGILCEVLELTIQFLGIDRNTSRSPTCLTLTG